MIHITNESQTYSFHVKYVQIYTKALNLSPNYLPESLRVKFDGVLRHKRHKCREVKGNAGKTTSQGQGCFTQFKAKLQAKQKIDRYFFAFSNF